MDPCLLATFLNPEPIGTTMTSLLWSLPLIASISVVYKATKVYKVRARPFIKETLSLFGSIVVFLIIAAVILSAIAWFFNEMMGRLS